jgi:hypothetical protein
MVKAVFLVTPLVAMVCAAPLLSQMFHSEWTSVWSTTLAEGHERHDRLKRMSALACAAVALLFSVYYEVSSSRLLRGISELETAISEADGLLDLKDFTNAGEKINKILVARIRLTSSFRIYGERPLTSEFSDFKKKIESMVAAANELGDGPDAERGWLLALSETLTACSGVSKLCSDALDRVNRSYVRWCVHSFANSSAGSAVEIDPSSLFWTEKTARVPSAGPAH